MIIVVVTVVVVIVVVAVVVAQSLLLLGEIAKSGSANCDIHYVTVAWSVRLSVCLYVRRLSQCARHWTKVTIGRKEMPFGRDTRVVPNNT